MTDTKEKFEDWIRKYQPVEDEIYADVERRRESRRRNLAERSRLFADLCEAIEALAKVVDVRGLRQRFVDDRWAMERLKMYVRSGQWRKLKKCGGKSGDSAITRRKRPSPRLARGTPPDNAADDPQSLSEP